MKFPSGSETRSSVSSRFLLSPPFSFRPPFPLRSLCQSTNIPDPSSIVVRSLPLTWPKFDLHIVEKLQKCFRYDVTNLALGLTALDRMLGITRGRITDGIGTSTLRGLFPRWRYTLKSKLRIKFYGEFFAIRSPDIRLWKLLKQDNVL